METWLSYLIIGEQNTRDRFGQLYCLGAPLFETDFCNLLFVKYIKLPNLKVSLMKNFKLHKSKPLCLLCWKNSLFWLLHEPAHFYLAHIMQRKLNAFSWEKWKVLQTHQVPWLFSLPLSPFPFLLVNSQSVYSANQAWMDFWVWLENDGDVERSRRESISRTQILQFGKEMN